jgi:hypothetical protein
VSKSKLTNERQRELASARREMRRSGAPDLFDAERRTPSDSPPPAKKTRKRRK